MLEELSNIQPYFNQSTNPFETTDMFINSKFAFCPEGNFNIECSRIYESMYNGCIPIVIANINKINNYKNMFELELPCYFVENIDEMKYIINNISNEELLLVQNKCINWCRNIGEIIRNNIINCCIQNNNLVESFINNNMIELCTNNNYYLIFILIINIIILYYITHK